MKLQVTRCLADGSVRSGGRELLAEPLGDGGWIWADIEGQDRDTEAFLLAQGFHPLAVEDTLTFAHQPKVEEYEGHLFAIVRGIDFNLEKGEELGTLKLAAFLDAHRLITVHRAPMRSVESVRQKIAASGVVPQGGPCHVLYLIWDALVDLYFPVVDDTAEELENLEEAIFGLPEPAHLERILTLRRRLATLRRVMLPHRQVFNHLAQSAHLPYLDAQSALYFRDIYDNVFRLADAIDLQREALANAKDTYLSVVSQRTNDIMKVLTLFSAILLPLTFIAGVYGMNFDNMPELHSRYGYFATLSTMIVVAVALVAWFRRKRWL